MMTATNTGTQLRSYGFSLLAMAIALSSLARSLHVAEPVALAMNIASGLASFTAIALFFKDATPTRRRSMLVSGALIVVAATVALVAVLHR